MVTKSAKESDRDVCKRHTLKCPKRGTPSPKAVELQPAESEPAPTGPIVPDPNLGLNAFAHCEPGQGSAGFDLRLQMDVDDITWAEQSLNLELLVCLHRAKTVAQRDTLLRAHTPWPPNIFDIVYRRIRSLLIYNRI